MRLYQQYGRLRCDNIVSAVLVQDSISGEVDTNACSVKRRGCKQAVKIQVGVTGGGV